MGDVLDKRLVIVTGKGGVGKTTVAAARVRVGRVAPVCVTGLARAAC